jgi:hypothetical protein
MLLNTIDQLLRSLAASRAPSGENRQRQAQVKRLMTVLSNRHACEASA